jgi:2-polyprenyl-3-methyl-5-hydroxy-6-metoxy-1,4-benzoquinol methylase
MASKERQIERWARIQHPYLINLSCVICGFTDLYNNFKKLHSNDIFNAGTLIRHQCPNCGLIFGDLRFLSLSEQEIQDDYDDTYSYFHEGNTANNIINNISSLPLFENKRLSYLDYACGIGKMIPTLKNLGYNVHGYDKYVRNENVLNNIDDMKFDVIYANNFIEHIANPIKDINRILTHLNDDGYLIMMSDCLDEYINEFTHFHVYFYTGNSFNILCNKLNLDIIESKTVGPCKIKVLKNNKNG